MKGKGSNCESDYTGCNSYIRGSGTIWEWFLFEKVQSELICCYVCARWLLSNLSSYFSISFCGFEQNSRNNHAS